VPAVSLLASLTLFLGTPLYAVMTRDTNPLHASVFALVAAVMLSARRWPFPGSRYVWLIIVATIPFAASLFFPPTATQPGRSWGEQLFGAHGFLALSPVLYFAAIGIVGYARSNALWTVATLALIGLWTMGPTLSGAIALLAIGIGWLIETARARPLVAAAPLVALALAWNYWLMVQYTVGALPKDSPVSFAALVRQQADVATQSPFFYPFAFPANAWFAWREGVPVDRYERLVAEPRTSTLDLVMNRDVGRFLLDGWDAPGSDAAGPSQWIGQSRATVLAPLDWSAPGDVMVSVLARARLEEPAVAADLALEINGHHVGRFVVPPAAPTEARVSIAAADASRVLRRGYNHLTFVSYGVHRLNPDDPRPPGPLGSRPGNRAWPVAIYRIRITPAP